MQSEISSMSFVDDWVANRFHFVQKNIISMHTVKVVLTLLWLFELQIEYTIATAGKYFRDKHSSGGSDPFLGFH